MRVPMLAAPPLPAGAPPRAVAALRELYAADATLGLRRPSAPTPRPLPGRDTIEYLSAVSTAIHADYARHLDALRVIDQISAAAPEPHVLAMALAPVMAQLAPFADAVKAGTR